MLTICLSAQLLWQRANTQNVIFLNLVNSIDNTKLSWYTLPQGSTTVSLETYPHYSFIIITIQLELKNTTTTTTTKTTTFHKRLTKCDPPCYFRDKGDNTHTHNTSCKMPIVLVTFTNSSEKYMDLLAVNFTLESFDWS